jgi:hypothetical protein
MQGERRLEDVVRGAVRDWFPRQCRNTWDSMYAYYLPNQMQIIIAADAPGPEWELAMLERVSAAWTEDQAWARLYQAARRLPLYPVD